MSEFEAANVSRWYELIKEIVADVRGKLFKEKRERLLKYQALFDAVRLAHVDYMSMFTRLLDDLIEAKSPSAVKQAKSHFRDARRKHSADRYISKHDADAHIPLTEDLGEKRFLASVIVYFTYNLDPSPHGESLDHLDMLVWQASQFGASHGWDSASSSFLFIVDHEENGEAIAKAAREIRDAIAKRFAVVQTTFSELDGNWRHSKALSQSKLQEMIPDFHLVDPTSPKES